MLSYRTCDCIEQSADLLLLDVWHMATGQFSDTNPADRGRLFWLARSWCFTRQDHA
jgi:hypothetical protein